MSTSVGVIFGGRSVEHEVSIITARQLMENIDKNKYKVVPIYISKQGDWYTGWELLRAETYRNLAKLPPYLTKVCLIPYPAKDNLIGVERGGLFKKSWNEHLDLVIPAVHGSHGEDGTLQGLLELADVPYVGSGVLGSALGMDKISMKAVLKEAGLPIVDYLWFTRSQWETEPETVMTSIESRLGYPVFVKPSDLGSSIGVKKVARRDDLAFALDVAGTYTRRLLVEKAVEDCIEINCSLLGDESDCQPSVCEQPITWQEFLTYEDKYLRGGSKQGMAGTKRQIPAPISEALTKQIQQMAVSAFKTLACRGVARVDFLVPTKTGRPFINEINTIPGSFSFYLWEAQGLKFPQMIDKLIELALKSHQIKQQTTFSMAGNLIQPGFKLGGKG
ncbi:MAG: D-alanine--D-alanine ligase [Candidatus Schekmanbacteria bacterium]|nr:D-alanine--D-alanine ligase [Candidatus Schekmanbacteria bacterium]